MVFFNHLLGLCIFFGFFLLSSCSLSSTSTTKGELLTNTTRTFSHFPPSIILAAADKLLVNADSSGFKVSHESNSLTAIKQQYSDTPSEGWRKKEERWEILATSLHVGSLVILTVERADSTLFGTTIAKPTGIATYSDFWNRLEYFLGLTDREPICVDNQRVLSTEDTGEGLSWLCETQT